MYFFLLFFLSSYRRNCYAKGDFSQSGIFPWLNRIANITERVELFAFLVRLKQFGLAKEALGLGSSDF